MYGSFILCIQIENKNDNCYFPGPQKMPTNFVVASRKFDCVTLTWEVPLYPNGEISHYQVGDCLFVSESENRSPSHRSDDVCFE